MFDVSYLLVRLVVVDLYFSIMCTSQYNSIQTGRNLIIYLYKNTSVSFLKQKNKICILDYVGICAYTCTYIDISDNCQWLHFVNITKVAYA